MAGLEWLWRKARFSGGFGANVSLANLAYEGNSRDDFVLFSETPCRFLISVTPSKKELFEEALSGFPLTLIGKTSNDPQLVVIGLTGVTIIKVNIEELKKAWQAPGL